MNVETNTRTRGGKWQGGFMPTVTLAPILARLINKIFNLSIVCTKVGYIVVGFPRAGIRGGNANNNSNDGLGYVNVNNAVGNANDNIGARLSHFSTTLREVEMTQYIPITGQ